MIPPAMDFLPWRRALPPTEPPLMAMITPVNPYAAVRLCEVCDVTWRGGPKCWCCGQRVPG